MSPAFGPFAIAAALLLAGGVLKAAKPGDTAAALRGVGLPIAPLVVRIGGASEAVLAAVALESGGRLPALLVAGSYLAFASFVVVALAKRAPIATCGCFGGVDTPPSAVHVVYDGVAVAAAVMVAVEPGDGFLDVIRQQPALGIPFVLLVSIGVLLSFVALSALPRTLALTRRSASV